MGILVKHNIKRLSIVEDSWARMIADSTKRETSLRKKLQDKSDEFDAYKKSADAKISALMEEIEDLKRQLFEKSGK
ncbi:hypothetical protein HA402_001535 [Bradysia odoriphaga]|nr:hypothetical protein HA402_001535 [Bradysia odoriphaga]